MRIESGRLPPLPAARGSRWSAVAIALALITIAGAYAWREHGIDLRLVRTDPARILSDEKLLARAVDHGRSLYGEHCATCHGAALEGSSVRGTPNLGNNVWLYASDPVNVEHTILYGIRSGHPKARNLTDMPALVRSGQISADDARDVVEFLESLAGARYDVPAAQRGRIVYNTTGNCFDCHASDARGVADYGAPALTGPAWLYGGDRQTLYESILNGRHGICQAWIGKLTPLQVRSLMLYLVTAPRVARSGARG